MGLRKSSYLKFLALLLFTFELLAPVYLSSRVDEQAEGINQLQLHSESPHSIFSSMLYEEAGNEEGREGKDHQKDFQYAAVINFVSLFNCLERLNNVTYTDTESFTSYVPANTSLNTLYGVFLI